MVLCKKMSDTNLSSPKLKCSEEFSKAPMERTSPPTQQTLMLEFLHWIILWPSLLKSSKLYFLPGDCVIHEEASCVYFSYKHSALAAETWMRPISDFFTKLCGDEQRNEPKCMWHMFIESLFKQWLQTPLGKKLNPKSGKSCNSESLNYMPVFELGAQYCSSECFG